MTSRGDESSRVTDLLYEAIVSGQFRVGDALPSEHDLAEALQTSRNSLRETLQRLALAGLVRRLRGRGTYLIGRSPIQRIDQPRYFERAFAPSPSVATVEPRFGFRVLDTSRHTGSEVLAHLLERAPDTPVVRLERLVLVAGRPVGHWTCYVPALPDDDPDLRSWQVPAPFEDLLHRHQPDRLLTEHLALQARWPTPASARHLQIGSFDPVLVLRRRFVDEKQRIVALCIGHCIEPAASFEVRRPVTTLSPAR